MKRIIAVFLVVLLLTPAVSAYTDQQVKTADALNHLGLFLGDGVDYNLDGQLTRAEGVTLLVRMIGKEARAKTISYTAPFTDVPDWAKGYINYAWMHKITNGISDTSFDPNAPMTDYMFLTLVLRVLGHSDKGDAPEFTWDNPYALAKSVGLIASDAPDASFRRGDAISIFWNALFIDDSALVKDLIENEIFSESQFTEAVDINTNGRKEAPGVPVLPDDPIDVPDDNDPDDDPYWPPVIIPPFNPGDDDEDDDNPPVNPPADDPNDDPNDNPPVNPPADDPNDDPPVVTVPGSYDEYQSLSPDEKTAFQNSFDSFDDFFAWLDEARENNDIKVDIGDGSVDLGGIGGN